MTAPGIRPVEARDADAIAGIYNHYVAETIVTFDEQPVAADDIARRIENTRKAELPWFVAEADGRLLG